MLEKISNNLAPYFREGLKIILAIYMAVAVVIFLFYSVLSVTYNYPMDYGEGPLLDQATRLAAGEDIYPTDLSSAPYTISNYPPLYVGLLSLLGPSLLAGRIISILSTMLAALFLGLIAHTLSRSRFIGMVAAVLFLATPYVVHWGGLLRIDMLAIALATGGLLLLVRWPEARWSLLAGGLLLVAAAYTRQSYALAAPLAAFAWIFAQDRRRALLLAGLVAGVGGLLFLALNIATGGGFYFNIVTANINEFGIERLQSNLEQLWQTGWPLLLLGAVFLVGGWSGDRKAWFLLAAFLLGGVITALTVGKIGSNVNYYIELSAALALVAAGLLLWTRKYPWLNVLVMAALVWQAGLYMTKTMYEYVPERLVSRIQDRNLIQELERTIADSEGPVLVDEYMALLPVMDRSLYIQPFEVTQLANAGVWDQTPFLESLRDQEFPLILIHHIPFFGLHRERWTPEMLSAIEANYSPFRTYGGTVVYKPSQPSDIQPVQVSAAGPAPPTSTGVSLQRLDESGNMFQPDIAVHPNNPDHLAAIAITATNPDCQLGDCRLDAILFTSMDGGETWLEQTPFSLADFSISDPQVAISPDGLLTISAVRDGAITTRQVRAENGYELQPGGQLEVTRAQVTGLYRLAIDPQNGDLYLSFDSQFLDRELIGPAFIRSGDNGSSWSSIRDADLRVSVADIAQFRITPLTDIQVMAGSGEQVALVWTWEPQSYEWPVGVWLALSDDGGDTFGEPVQIASTWGLINSTFHNGVYYLLYRGGSAFDQSLMLARSEDGGLSWEATPVSGNISLAPDFETGAGLGVSPNGTVDSVFYTPQDSSCALDQEQWRNSFLGPWTDTCLYDVYHTFAPDGGARFVPPIQLNEAPIRGEMFLHLNGRSTMGSHLSVASTDEAAFPVWIGTDRGESVLMTARIDR